MPVLSGATSFTVQLRMPFRMFDLESPTLSHFDVCMLHEWFSGRTLACHVGEWGSILHSCILILVGYLRRAQFRFEEKTPVSRDRFRRSCHVSYNQSVLWPPNSAIRLHDRFGLLHTKPWGRLSFFDRVLVHNEQGGSMLMQDKDRGTSSLAACLKYLYV